MARHTIPLCHHTTLGPSEQRRETHGIGGVSYDRPTELRLLRGYVFSQRYKSQARLVSQTSALALLSSFTAFTLRSTATSQPWETLSLRCNRIFPSSIAPLLGTPKRFSTVWKKWLKIASIFSTKELGAHRLYCYPPP